MPREGGLVPGGRFRFRRVVLSPEGDFVAGGRFFPVLSLGNKMQEKRVALAENPPVLPWNL